jgi:hypothetical protein
MVFCVVQYHHKLLSHRLIFLERLRCQLSLRKRCHVLHTMKTKNKQKYQTIINVTVRINTEVYEPTIPNYSEN